MAKYLNDEYEARRGLGNEMVIVFAISLAISAINIY